MSLTEFLLARIAEDEGRASWHHRLLCMRNACDAECCWGEATDEAIAAERVCTCGYPARVLAECEAKRRIVDRVTCKDDACGDHDCGIIREDRRSLATIYADDPDYDEAWRPQ